MSYDSSIPVTPDRSGHLKITPTDVSQYIRLEQCRRYLRLRLHERSNGREFLTDYGVWPQTIPPLLTRSGSEFEAKTEEAVAARYPTFNFAASERSDARHGSARTPDNTELVQMATSLQPGETLCLFQVKLVAEIGAWSMRGDLDILRMERDPEGALHIKVADMKS